MLAHVARNLTERLTDPESVRDFALPSLVATMIERGWVGEKAGQGFYKKVDKRHPDAGARDARCTGPGSRHASRRSKRPSRSPIRVNESKRSLLGRDKVGDFLRATLGETLVYAAKVTPEIAHSIDDVDRAMQWGFAWEFGPFEIWDAVGVRDLVEAMKLATPPRSSRICSRAAAPGSGTTAFRQRDPICRF